MHIQNLETSLIIGEYGLPETREYKSFTEDYVGIAQQYNDQKNELINNNKSLDLERMFWNSVKGGFAGGLFEPVEYLAPAGALTGFSLTLYDELKNLRIDLSNVFWGVIGGGLAGSFAGGEETSYVGATLGGSIGIYKMIKDSRKNMAEEKNKVLEQVKILENDSQDKKKRLIDLTRSTLETKELAENRKLLAQEQEREVEQILLEEELLKEGKGSLFTAKK